MISVFFFFAGEKLLFEMPITDILAVERLEEESFKMKYVSIVFLLCYNELQICMFFKTSKIFVNEV